MPNENGFYSSSAAPVLYRFKLPSVLPLTSSLSLPRSKSATACLLLPRRVAGCAAGSARSLSAHLCPKSGHLSLYTSG
jgi:hypothetical protein